MTGRLLYLNCAITVSFLAAGLTAAGAEQTCEALKNLKLEDATVVEASSHETAPLELPAAPPLKLPPFTVPGHCEVKVVARPSSDSEITFLLWLPSRDEWNGKYMQNGSGGWAGVILPIQLVPALKRGYASSATDDGHKSDISKGADASWAIGHPEKLIDFGYRAVHETAILSKKIVEAYYGKSAAEDYFFGCSDGGREALMEAERYPEDFNGIVAGAPANFWTHLMTGFAWDEVAMNANPQSKITPQQVHIVEKAAVDQCDAVDGVKDGLIQDPRQCHFDPEELLCKSAPGEDCLTQSQIDALKKVYQGPQDPKTGEQIFPGYWPGNEAEFDNWILGSAQSQFANSFFSGAVYENPKWDWHTFNLERDVRVGDEKTASILNSYNPDLRSFRDHGGKLIQYHGWGDGAIAPVESIDFYESVVKFLKTYPDPRTNDAADIDAFYRLFMVPSMGHCGGGVGPVSFGQDPIQLILTGHAGDADHDVVAALDRWVTQGKAPDKILATGTIGADPKTKSGGVPITRPLCVYPATLHYKGHGDTNAAENFECVHEPAN
jgi:feruloyl esterase